MEDRNFHSSEPKKVGVTSLSAGETACLDLVADGLGSKAIARRLDISPHTVDARLKSACAKLATRSRFHAATILREAGRNRATFATTSDPAKLIYEDRSISEAAFLVDKTGSAEEGDGSGGLRTWQGPDRQAHASRDGKSWLEPDYPIAKFFGGENRLAIGQRLLAIFAIAIGAAIAVGILANALVGISRL